MSDFDLLIVGAGPAGCTLALKLANKGLRIGIIEKDIFPRSKICGDALSGKALNVLKRLPDGIYQDFIAGVEKTPSYGFRFIAPNHHLLDVPFFINYNKVAFQEYDGWVPLPPTFKEIAEPPGYICRRSVFDQFLFNKLSAYSDVKIIGGKRIRSAMINDDHVVIKTDDNEYTAKMVAGADGVHSIIRKDLSLAIVEKRHFCLGIRGYFHNVANLHPKNFIELIFLKPLLPGYFWIFPSTGGQVNAGFGMMQNQVLKRKVNLLRLFDDLIRNHPLLAPRFANSTLIGKPEAHSLPMGTFNFNRSGNRFILLGDAAFLVDPFSGEGIGNAMASGEIASSIILDCWLKKDFSADALNAYNIRIQKRFGQEFRTTAIMQKLARFPWLMNLVVDKAGKNRELRDLLTAMITKEELKKKLTQPGFYARLLFR